ncbi:MAG TPA: ABC transporter substrate-binding protein, partial [Planctomycetota bacterium]|nr:ABC transporter substrate-binding protein [Planctomycetota bacterium]
EPPVVLSLFQEGKLDQATLSPDQWKNNADDPTMQKIARRENGIANSYYYVGYNLRKPVFQDPRVRKALTMLIDRTAIIHTIFNDNATPLTGPFHPLSPDNDATVSPIPCDPAAAVKLLNDAGWRDTDNDGVLDKDGVPFEYNLMYRSGRPEHEQIAAYIQQANRKVGIKTNLVVLEWSAFIDRINKQDYTACILGWALSYSQDPYQLWHSSQAEPNMSNFVGYNDPVSDQLIVQGRYTLDPVARHALYHQLHQRIADAQPYTFLFVPKNMIVYAKRYEDVKYTLLGTAFERYWVKPENQRPLP